MNRVSNQELNNVSIEEISGGMLPFVVPHIPNQDPGTYKLFQPRDGEVYEILIDLIKEGGHLRRIDYDDDQKVLEESIRENGLLHPIIVSYNIEKSEFNLVAGKRRLYAVKSLGKRTIQCMVKDADPLLIYLCENIMRKDLSEMQLAEGLLMVKKNLRITQKDLGKLLKKSPTNMSNIMCLNKFPEKVKDMIRDESFSRRFLLDLLTYDSTDKMIQAIKNEKMNMDGVIKRNETKASQSESERSGSPSNPKKQPEKVVIKKLESTISAAVKLTPFKLTKEDQNQLKELYVTLGKLLNMI
jgi:ParB/RepB/Spo0J family partition protein